MTKHPEHLLARAADGAAMPAAERQALEEHLEGCASCREALDGQCAVSRALAARIASEPAPAFASRVSARLDAGQPGILDLANWRAWTVGLAPVAAALVFVAYLGVGITTTSDTVTTSADAPTFDSWAAASAGTTPAAVFLQPSSSSDQLLETVLTGAAPSTSREASDVR